MSASSRERPHRDQRTRMLEEPVPRLVLTLAVPTIISMMVTSIYYYINFSIFLLNFERRIASETLASSRKFKVQIQGTPLDFRGY